MATNDLTAETLGSTIDGNDIVILDFWAEWCGPCKAFGPVFDAASERHPDVAFGKIDTQNNQDLAAELQISSIPTLMVFREKVLVFRQPGAMPPAALEELLTKVKALDMAEVHAKIADNAPN